ncbi:MAG: hypothetical protein ABSG05_01175 [Candidatus Pacearchaeota archaeon]|jgi:hypothetical protein
MTSLEISLVEPGLFGREDLVEKRYVEIKLNEAETPKGWRSWARKLYDSKYSKAILEYFKGIKQKTGFKRIVQTFYD